MHDTVKQRTTFHMGDALSEVVPNQAFSNRMATIQFSNSMPSDELRFLLQGAKAAMQVAVSKVEIGVGHGIGKISVL